MQLEELICINILKLTKMEIISVVSIFVSVK